VSISRKEIVVLYVDGRRCFFILRDEWRSSINVDIVNVIDGYF